MPPPHQPIISLQIPETMTKSPGLSRDRPFPSGTRLASRYRCNVFIFHQYGLPPLRSQIKTIIQNVVVVFVFVFVVVIRCYELSRCSGRGGYHRCVPWPSPCSLRLLELLFVKTLLTSSAYFQHHPIYSSCHSYATAQLARANRPEQPRLARPAEVQLHHIMYVRWQC